MEDPNQMPESAPATTSQDDKNLGLLLWLTTIFLVIVPGLVYYLLKQDNEFLLDQAKESLNWAITAALGYIVGVLTVVLVIGIFVIFAVAVLHLVFCIMGAVATYKGQKFRAPFALRLIK